MNDFFFGVASFVLVLVPLVILHELGHFFAAKLAGITVLEFGIGFPPRVKVLFTRGDTLYTLNWLPIGGFVRPYGEDFVKPKKPDELSADEEEIRERGIENPKSVFQATPWEKLFFLAAGPGINLLAALVIFIVIALVGQPFLRADVAVYDVQPNSVAAEAGLQADDVILAVNGEEVESAAQFNDLIAKYTNQPVTLLVQRGDEQFEVTFVVPPAETNGVERVYVQSVERDMPAYEAGFQPEDLIIAVDGIEITSIKQLQDYTHAHEGQEMIVTVLRGTDTLEIPVTPRKDDNGVVRIGIGIVGVEPASIGLVAVNHNERTYTRALPPGEAIRTGVDEFVELHKMMYQFVRDLVSGNVGWKEARPVSPVGIGQMGGPVLEQTLSEREMYPIARFAALISVALGLTNLLPIPGLDGGRILFVLIEIIRGKPMEPEREGLINFIGIALLLGLVFLTVINDIINPLDINNLR